MNEGNLGQSASLQKALITISHWIHKSHKLKNWANSIQNFPTQPYADKWLIYDMFVSSETCTMSETCTIKRELPLKQIWSMKVNNYQRIFQSCISSQSLSLPFPLLYDWCFLLTLEEFSLFDSNCCWKVKLKQNKKNEKKKKIPSNHKPNALTKVVFSHYKLYKLFLKFECFEQLC